MSELKRWNPRKARWDAAPVTPPSTWLADENAALRARLAALEKELAYARSTGDESAIEYRSLRERLEIALEGLDAIAHSPEADDMDGSPALAREYLQRSSI